ncbi:MAG: hypothetical protein VW475_09485 [Curvibacter sp.]
MNLDKLLKALLGVLLRTVLLLMGLVFLLSLLAAAALLLLWWGLRALWARLTGRPVQPLVFTVLSRARWQRFYPGAAGPRAAQDDVIDVESRQVDRSGADRIGR